MTSGIHCAKCKSPAAPGDSACAKCGGGLVQSCPDCGADNNHKKRFCDHCGTALPQAGQAAAPPAPGPSAPEKDRGPIHLNPPPPTPPPKPPPAPADPAAGPERPRLKPPPGPDQAPKTGIIRIQKDQPEPGANPKIPIGFDPFRGPPPPKPAPGPAAQAAGKRTPAPAGRRTPSPRRTPSKFKPITDTLRRLRPERFNWTTGVAVLLLLGGLGVWGRQWYLNSRPDAVLKRTAHRYLSALKAGDFEAAHALLTDAARENCPIEEFKLIRPQTPWDFSNLSVVLLEDDAAFLRYTKTEQGREPEEDYLLFVREKGRWTRPFTWNLLNKIEDAYERNDTDMAYLLARAAVRVDRRDPMSQAYLCEAAYMRGAMEEAERECRAAVELFKKYPSKLNPKSLFHIHAILGDLYKNALKRHPEAVEEYTVLLRFPDLGDPDRCELLLARGESRVWMGDHAEALDDYKAAEPACAKEEDKADLRRAVRVLSGAAGLDAVTLAQAQPTGDGGPSLLEWRDQVRREVAAKLRARGDRSALPTERWGAQHLGGPLYKVTVRSGQSADLSAVVNLWANTVQDVRMGGQ